MARPQWKPSSEQRATVNAMTACGIRQREICAVIGVSVPTLEKKFRTEIETGLAMANSNVAERHIRPHQPRHSTPASKAVACVRCFEGRLWGQSCAFVDRPSSRCAPIPAIESGQSKPPDSDTAGGTLQSATTDQLTILW